MHAARAKEVEIFFDGAHTHHKRTMARDLLNSYGSMVKFRPTFKHDILKQYTAGDRHHSFRALARRYSIPGGKSVIESWFHQWNGSPHSLERRRGTGRRALLTPKQVERLLVKPIRRCNRNHLAVEYPELREAVEHEVGHSVSLRTIQRYGKEKGGIHDQSTIPRTPEECMT